MKKIFAALMAVTALGGLQAFAQDFNPTVEVTNAYDVNMVDADKPLEKMAVPDSLLKFDLEFDYSVLSNKYEGGYDFNPYFLEMRPEADAYRGRKFFLKAGAGYPLSQKGTVVWSPRLKNSALDIDVHADADSYMGKYFTISPLVDEKGEGFNRIGHVRRAESDKDSLYSGRDVKASFGVDLRHDWERHNVTASVGYDGIYTKDRILRSDMNSANASINFARNDESGSHFCYGAGIAFRISADDTFLATGPYLGNLSSGEFVLSGMVGQVLRQNNAVLVDINVAMNTLKGFSGVDAGEQSGMLSFTPKYVMGGGRMRLSAGVRFDLPTRSGLEVDGVVLHRTKGQIIYPDVHFAYQLVPGRLDGYADVTGGLDVNSYSSLKARNHFINPAVLGGAAYDNTNERINAVIGFRGNVASVFRYDISGGFASRANDVVGYVAYSSDFRTWTDTFVLQDRNSLHADLSFALDLDSFIFDGSMRYEHSNHFGKGRLGFEQAPFSFDIRARYDWNDRIFAGVHADGATARRGLCMAFVNDPVQMRIPGYVNLGLDAEFVLNRKLSLWLCADNLLCQTVLRTPVHARRGMNITGGICMNL